MTSETAYEEAYVWVWLPGTLKPVVAGRLAKADNQLVFNYGRSYLARADAISLYEPELPLQAGFLPLTPGLDMPSCIRDAAPDAWGRRVVINRKFGSHGKESDTNELDELTYLLESGSDRFGAIDFQISPTLYKAHQERNATLDELMNAVASVEEGTPLSNELDQALFHGSSLGGARPKAMIAADDRKYVAKFSSRTDVTNVVKGEFIAMRLAAECGLSVAPVKLERIAEKDVLLIERFDRRKTAGGWERRAAVSALTLFGLDEMMARYASYEELATIIRHRFTAPGQTLKELFGRIVFNILCGNTDDHARNHAAFWDGKSLTLTPAYDICPQQRAGEEATQAMLIVGNNRFSQLATCVAAAANFLISPADAIAIINGQIRTIVERWDAICRVAEVTEIERNLMWRHQFLNRFAFVDAPEGIVDPAD